MTEVVTWEWTRGVHWRDKCRRRPLTALALPHNQWESPTLGYLSRVFPGLHPAASPPHVPFPTLSVNHRARQINSLRFSAFQLPLPPLPDHVVYPEEESGVFGMLERIHSLGFQESRKWRRNARSRHRISFPHNWKSGKFRLLYKWSFSTNKGLILLFWADFFLIV